MHLKYKCHVQKNVGKVNKMIEVLNSTLYPDAEFSNNLMQYK